MIADSKVYVQFIKTLSDLHPEDSVMQLINKTLGSTSKDIDIWRESIHDFGTLIEEVFGGTI